MGENVYAQIALIGKGCTATKFVFKLVSGDGDTYLTGEVSEGRWKTVGDIINGFVGWTLYVKAVDGSGSVSVEVKDSTEYN